MGTIARQELERLDEHHPAAPEATSRMRLRYGLSENELWTETTSAGDAGARVRQAAAQIVRLSVKDDWDQGGTWPRLENYLVGVMAAGAVPMITLSKFGRPYEDGSAIRWFARSAANLVRRSIDRWGPETVREWLWCLGDQPNSDWLNAGLTFDLYRHIYEAAAQSVVECLTPYLHGQAALVGGPGIDGFQPFWMDWVYRFVNEIDNRLIRFVVWYRYGDWRQPGEWGSPGDENIFRALLMSRTAEYETRARAVGRILKGRPILNICGELNAHSNHFDGIGRILNGSDFGAAYYGSALIHLMRGAADVEMLRSAAHGGTPQHLTKQLCARFVGAGDDLAFPRLPRAQGRADIVLATGPDGALSAFLVHRCEEPFALSLEDVPALEQCRYTCKIDGGTNGTLFQDKFDGELLMNGYGVAVLTNREAASA
jgi:hypothetical protein